MPLYEYECQQCGERTEVLQRFSDAPLETCESCGGELDKLISPPAVQFKGTGWYVTDYAGKKPVGGGESKSGNTAGSTDKKSASGDGKSSPTSSSKGD